ncbi:sensor histidine kinase [Halomonas cupida]|uniref:histidine kinase n=1 Tax=Halomonas cupida TaxID=44933 RepID=A0A1M7C0X1_9GAMM|nr:PAS domain S-box protein [Halomonas cupida]GEN24692.1 hypothetical protein HCU01_26410 [Halomonas cupida]SHL60489.1 PAS domain S-box-containing protein [Halomonas cupida]
MPDKPSPASVTDSQRIQALEERVRQLESEKQHFQWLAESTTDLISRHDQNGVFLYASRAARDLLGYDPEELIGVSAYDLFHPDDLRALLAKSPRIYYHEGFYQQTYRFRARSGHYVWFETTSRTRRATDGELIDILCVSRDVSRRLDAEAQTRRLQQQVAHANRRAMLGELASNIAHECNQPLATMSNYASGALMQLKRQPGQPASQLAIPLQRINDQIERLSARLRHIRQFVRNGDVRCQALDIGDILAAVRQLCQWQCEQQGVVLDISVDDDLPRVQADAIAMEQILVNLILNAEEACRRPANDDHRDHCSDNPDDLRQDDLPQDTEGRIQVCAWQLSAWEVAVDVRDNGPGITADQVDRVLAPLVASPRTPAPEQQVGLGLSISHSLAEAMGGNLVLVSAGSRSGDAEQCHETQGDETVERAGMTGAIFRVILPSTPDNALPRTMICHEP